MNKKVLLMILDGWGIAQKPEVSAIDHAHTPFIDSLSQQYPYTTLEASGLAVGLPEGQMGNSEVGHMNIGAGRVVYQDLVRINQAIQQKTLAQNTTLLEALAYAKKQNVALHFIGLVSDGGVHSHIEHLKALCEIAKEQGVERFYIHAFTDGRDTDPQGGIHYIDALETHLKKIGVGKIASIVGRYYAMDRDKRWERVKLAYDLLVNGIGSPASDAKTAIENAYKNNITDEFIPPVVIVNEQQKPIATIKEGDCVICFNFRTDRGRQITEALTQKAFHEQNMHPLALKYLTLTSYDDSFEAVEVIFQKDNLEDTLGEIIAKNNKTQLRIAETEKYPHVTFFFSGGREVVFEGEKRILCPSPKVPTYDLQPEMSANEIKEAVLPILEEATTDFICLNFANPDMVGHTGDFEATVKACQTVDACAKTVVEKALAKNYACLIIADHGNADYMRNDDQSPNTAHTTNLVPCWWVDKAIPAHTLNKGKLANIAPTVLALMGIAQPTTMNEKSLINFE
ncbi:MAG: 2,3-bisphosphoglycerate-independent phosphoglycerate mutase [Cytophagales bacterium]|nr:MAG: 2,3-bisphosphoglycerate-independent phosphoglycerate mutase [Cytophagales bacterium]